MSDFKTIRENPSDILYQQPEIIKVLLIEDNPGDARLVKEMLVDAGTNKFSFVHAGLISEGLAFLRNEGYHVILLDLELPDGHGLDNIRQVCALAPHLPVVILTGLDDETTAIRAVQEGAEDYLVKGQMDSNLLARAIRYAIERKRAEEALRKSEKEYRSVIENIQDVFYRSDITGSLSMGSPSGAKMFGYNTIDEMIGLPLDSFWPDPKDRERLLGQIKATGNVKDFEAVLKKKDGTTFDASFTTHFCYDDNGDFLGTEGIIRDITERKRAEEALHASEAQLSNALKIAHLGHWEYDVASDLFTFNDHFYAIFRTTAEREGGYTMSSAQYAQRFIHPDDRSVINAEIRKAIETTNPHYNCQLEHKMIYADGELGYIAVRFFIIKDDKGRTVKKYGVNQDITERKRAEEILYASEAQLSNALKIAHLGHWEYDVASDLFTFNDHFYAIFRTTAEREGGYTMSSAQYAQRFVHPDDCSVVSAEIQKALETTNPHYNCQLEHRMIYTDGEVGHIAVHFFVIKNDKGHTIKTYGVNQDITERKRVEELLRESEAKFQQLFDEAPVGYHVYDTQGRITKVNRTELEMLGYTLEEMLGQPVWKFIGDEETSRNAVLAKIAGTIPPARGFERAYCRKDGTTFPVLIEDRALRDNEGRIIGIQSTIQDITERKRMEDALRESENKFRDLAEKSLVGIYLVQDGVFKYINARVAEISGYAVEELIDKNGPEYLTFPKDWPMVEENAQKRLSDEVESRHLEFRGITKDNRIINLEAYGSQTMYRGRPAVIGTLLDITDRKRAEEKLRESEEKFRQLAENIREVFYISEQGITRYVSPAYMEIWGRTPQSLYEEPKSILDTIHPEDRDRVKRSFRIKSQGEVEEVYRIVRPDGSIRWIKDRSFPIYDDSGKTHRFVGIAADITDSKLGEEKLKYISLHDSLTGLYNRIYFEEEMSRIERGRYDTVGILSCDVDGLKLVNDTLGHDQGDNLLIAAARVIRECFREGDLVARIGGDEFSVLLPDTTEPAVENACQRIQEAVASYNATKPELPLSISVGFAINNGVYRNLKDLFKEADNHMYRKKLYGTKSVRSTIVKTLINTLKARDRTAESHIIRLEKLLASIAAFIGLPESTKSDLSLLAKFHDIGKVGIADSILFKEAPLTSEEWTEMKRHCEIGYRIALSAPELVPIADWILKHHEWWNGQGYPLNIEGEEIPIECRLLTIVDTYEVLTSACPYRKTFSHREAVAELKSFSGKQFDPKLLEKFLQMLETRSPESEFNATAI